MADVSAVGPQYGFGLYVHWPYCTKICPYCDFNVYAAKTRETAPLLAGILDDIARHRALLPDHPKLDSLFFGGGTPSLLKPLELEAILTAAEQTFGLKPGAEITLEANPNDVLRAEPSDWVSVGINRLSLGIQSLRDDALTFLGRDHGSRAARAAITSTQAVFDNHSLDFIYARPDQSADDWKRELIEVLSFGAPHLSLYELTIEERTAFGKRAARGDLIPLDEEGQADLYELTQTLCTEAGLPAYEISNHARGERFQSVHNHIYWNSGDWIGVGPGAHGRLTVNGQRFATEAPRRPVDYLAQTTLKKQALPDLDIARELMSMGLRPARGLNLQRLEDLLGPITNSEALDDLWKSGWIELNDGWLRLAPRGRLLADHITGLLDPS
ncbi:MAG: radical SAM family heme chaperone HemW [Henriciella sp.]|nr:radical SAM family heme chaperone HemW [Henriciella sp.]